MYGCFARPWIADPPAVKRKLIKEPFVTSSDPSQNVPLETPIYPRRVCARLHLLSCILVQHFYIQQTYFKLHLMGI